MEFTVPIIRSEPSTAIASVTLSANLTLLISGDLILQSERYSDIYFVPFSSSFFSAKRVPSIATLLPGSNSAGELGFSEKRHINVVESKSASSESGSKFSSS